VNDTNEQAVIMVVDDIPANLERLAEILHRDGYRVVAFPRGAMALRAAAQNPPDLILLDVMMPEMDGFEVCQRLKTDQTLKEIPVIFISALDDIANRVKAFSEGGVDYISKPFHEEEVLTRVRTHLDLRRQQIKIRRQKEQIEHSYERLREMEEQRDKLVLMVIHDLRSPLTGILGYAELLTMKLENWEGCEKPAKFAADILASAQTLNALISTLLDISRMESREMPLEKAVCDLRDVVSRAVVSLGALVQEATVVCEPPAESVTAFCDPVITRRIIENLTANAIKFTGRGNPVRIELSREANTATVRVSDSGPGIPPEYHQRIFEKFGQLAVRRESGRNYSTGLGLTFCKLAVEAQGGRIGVQSGVGKGSTFWFELPVAP